MDKKSNDALKDFNNKIRQKEDNKKFKYPYVRNQEHRISDILKRMEKKKEKENDESNGRPAVRDKKK